MANPVEPLADRRQLGRSRAYTRADLPGRLRHWHAPRINRWERLCVTAGPLGMERLGAAGVTAELLAADDTRWIAPGTRWRVAQIGPVARFELEIYAEAQSATVAPHPLREALLAAAERVECANAHAFEGVIANLAVGERCVLHGRFDWRAPLRAAMEESGQTLFWHPLIAGGGGFTAFVARAARAFDLAQYLGRDHAVIEAALAGMLRGDTEYTRWLHAALERHLHIEEDLLFPAYMEAGGRAAWVRGLKNEHTYLRQYRTSLAEPDSRRKFLRLLDGHDEKEERIVYPDMLAHLGSRADDLTTSTILFSLPIDET